MNENNGLPAIKKENIFNRIISFFKNIFSKKEIAVNEIKDENINYNSTTSKINSFKEELKEKINNRERLLEIQKLIKFGKIKERDLKKEDVIELKQLYKEQISQIKNSIQDYNSKIVTLKKKIAQNS